MTASRAHGGALTSASPAISVAEAERIAAEHYGIVGTAERLRAEADENFRIAGRGGSTLLRVAHAGEAPEATNLVTSALLHLEAHADLPVPRVVRTLAAEPELHFVSAEGDERTARMTTFLPGDLLRSVPSTPALRANVGRTLARLGLALRTFEHPAAHRELLWDLGHADRTQTMLDELEDAADRDLAAAPLARFEASVRPRLRSLRRQVVHNDFSTDNVLVADDAITVAGAIDFGDIVFTQLVNDLAIAATSQVVDGDDPFAPVVDLARGYHAVSPLRVEELELVSDLVRVRLAIYLVIAGWRAVRFPENRDYVLRNGPRVRALLRRLERVSGAEVAARLIAACPDPQEPR